MFCLFNILLISTGFTFLFYLINTNLWFLFLWIPLGIIAGILVFLLWLYAVVLPIYAHTKPDYPLKNWYTVHVLKMINWLCGVRFHVEGKENLVSQSNVMFVANHKSQLDPCLIYAAIGRSCAIAAKSTLWKVAPLKPLMKAFRVLKINRENDRESIKSILKGIDILKNNNSVLIFPEGGIKTREVEQMVSLKAGAYKLATKSQAIIQPIAIIGSSKLAKRKFWQWYKVTVRFLPAIYPEDYMELNTHEIGYKVIEMVNANFIDERQYEITEEV